MYNAYNPYYNYNAYMPQSVQQPMQNTMYRASGLQGKQIDNLEVVKAADIPLDGSVSYFPLVDGSAIVTKQLQQDGTSKIVVFRPVEDNHVSEQPKYLTEDAFKEQIKDINSKDIKDIREELKALKRRLEDISDDIKNKKED